MCQEILSFALRVSAFDFFGAQHGEFDLFFNGRGAFRASFSAPNRKNNEVSRNISKGCVIFYVRNAKSYFFQDGSSTNLYQILEFVDFR